MLHNNYVELCFSGHLALSLKPLIQFVFYVKAMYIIDMLHKLFSRHLALYICNIMCKVYASFTRVVNTIRTRTVFVCVHI